MVQEYFYLDQVEQMLKLSPQKVRYYIETGELRICARLINATFNVIWTVQANDSNFEGSPVDDVVMGFTGLKEIHRDDSFNLFSDEKLELCEFAEEDEMVCVLVKPVSLIVRPQNVVVSADELARFSEAIGVSSEGTNSYQTDFMIYLQQIVDHFGGAAINNMRKEDIEKYMSNNPPAFPLSPTQIKYMATMVRDSRMTKGGVSKTPWN